MWRSDPRKPWKVYGFTRATFGDIAAGLLLEVARRKGVEEARSLGKTMADEATRKGDCKEGAAMAKEAECLLETARQIEEYVYVDDGALGGDKTLVESMMGKGVLQKGTVTATLATVGLTPKHIIQRGTHAQKVQQSSEEVFWV